MSKEKRNLSAGECIHLREFLESFSRFVFNSEKSKSFSHFYTLGLRFALEAHPAKSAISLIPCKAQLPSTPRVQPCWVTQDLQAEGWDHSQGSKKLFCSSK